MKRLIALALPFLVLVSNDTLWRAGWLVHEGPQALFAPELVADLATIGCDLGLEGTSQ